MHADDEPDWHIQEWADALGKKQADMVRNLGWTKNTAHKLWHGKQPYRRDILNAAARWLGIEPYELLMPPAEAIALRRLRETAIQIAKDQAPARRD